MIFIHLYFSNCLLFRVRPPIEFQPSDFMDKETGELISDEELMKEATKRTNETVFTASGMIIKRNERETCYQSYISLNFYHNKKNKN
jgi:hypothetical protein